MSDIDEWRGDLSAAQERLSRVRKHWDRSTRGRTWLPPSESRLLGDDFLAAKDERNKRAAELVRRALDLVKGRREGG